MSLTYVLIVLLVSKRFKEHTKENSVLLLH
jgi:hypothetical protein